MKKAKYYERTLGLPTSFLNKSISRGEFTPCKVENGFNYISENRVGEIQGLFKTHYPENCVKGSVVSKEMGVSKLVMRGFHDRLMKEKPSSYKETPTGTRYYTTEGVQLLRSYNQERLEDSDTKEQLLRFSEVLNRLQIGKYELECLVNDPGGLSS